VVTDRHTDTQTNAGENILPRFRGENRRHQLISLGRVHVQNTFATEITTCWTRMLLFASRGPVSSPFSEYSHLCKSLHRILIPPWDVTLWLVTRTSNVHHVVCNMQKLRCHQKYSFLISTQLTQPPPQLKILATPMVGVHLNHWCGPNLTTRDSSYRLPSY